MSATDAYESIADLRNRVFPPDQRQPGGVAGIAISVVSVLFCLMTLGMAFQVVITPIQVSMLHLAIAIPMTFMLYPALFRPEGSESRLPTPADFLFAALALAIDSSKERDVVHIGEHDLHSLFAETTRQGQPDTAGRAGHDGHLVFEHVYHNGLLGLYLEIVCLNSPMAV